jgi:hypothetical protein
MTKNYYCHGLCLLVTVCKFVTENPSRINKFLVVMVDGKSIIKYFGCCSFKQARGAKQIAPASKNKWVENWYRYWFYHKVPLVEEKNQANSIVKRYPLTAKMHKNSFDCKPEFQSLRSSKSCEKFYKLTAQYAKCPRFLRRVYYYSDLAFEKRLGFCSIS